MASKTLVYILIREPIIIAAIKCYISNVGGVRKVRVLRIKNSFLGITTSTVKGACDELKKRRDAQAFVVYVRGNLGGLLPDVVDTASRFLDENQSVVAYVVDKKGMVNSQATFVPGIDLKKSTGGIAIMVAWHEIPKHNAIKQAEYSG